MRGQSQDSVTFSSFRFGSSVFSHSIRFPFLYAWLSTPSSSSFPPSVAALLPSSFRAPCVRGPNPPLTILFVSALPAGSFCLLPPHSPADRLRSGARLLCPPFLPTILSENPAAPNTSHDALLRNSPAHLHFAGTPSSARTAFGLQHCRLVSQDRQIPDPPATSSLVASDS